MQNIKDSFYIALRDRLALLSPDRIVNINGDARPALVVIENSLPDAAEPQPEVFYLRWPEIAIVIEANRSPQPLLRLKAEIAYWVQGTEALNHQDRGRALAQADSELLAICYPQSAALMDFTQAPAQALETRIFWARPELRQLETNGHRLERTAVIDVFGYAEVDC
jgi:hypothetical protein